jgi:8-oxo-dGTP pyrophosphatase MutT (NUDIX family)
MRRMVAAVIFRKSDGKYLILRRKLHWKGWEFVKGRVGHETYKQAAMREVREETGIRYVHIMSKLQPEVVYHHKNIDGHTVSVQKAFLVEYFKGVIKPSFEHNGYKWVDAKTAHKMLTHTSHRTFLKYADKHVREFEAHQRNKLIEELSKKHPTMIHFTRNRISFRYDGERIVFKVVRRNVKDVGEWSYRKPIVYYDKNLNSKSVLPVVIHEAVEKFVVEKYGLKEDIEAHKVASAVEKEFIASRKWISQQKMVSVAWVKANKRKVGNTKFY